MSGQDGEAETARRKRLRFRAWHRGTKEMDLIMGPFADDRLERMSREELDQFEGLLLEPEPDVYAWVVGDEAPPAGQPRTVLDQIIAFHANRHA